MLRTMLKSKIHRATVTDADLHYVGSVTVDEDLMDAADLLSGERVAIVDITNGARLETYVIPGARGSGAIGINGAAAHLVAPGDLVILISYGTMDDAEARHYQPRVVFVDNANRVAHRGDDPAHAPAGSGLMSGSAGGGLMSGSAGGGLMSGSAGGGLMSGSAGGGLMSGSAGGGRASGYPADDLWSGAVAHTDGAADRGNSTSRGGTTLEPAPDQDDLAETADAARLDALINADE